ncbi:helix-turn-helix domain-containing protein [Enterococcus dispar]|uniref:helix-turn-helix domain-containing protein n=1 Tax=Enterococcus dispar TaxID=44009 RepID=UPI0021D3FD2C|nr:helix-turn-helix domain-containing protein [Enterococcus dispar]MCU7357457.1 helix-turn-helix domain-containing protein [Enterococcus dispar]
MYTLLKRIITEKDLHRQIRLLEQLLHQPQITAKELAYQIQTTERTVFSDLQIIKEQLPNNWQIKTDSSGIALLRKKDALTNDLWDAFLPHSFSVQLMKALLFQLNLAIKPFLRTTGVSFETLKRHTKKINTQLQDYHLQIKLTATNAKIVGLESNIRIFYHRLLVPFTHNNYFFSDYAVHEVHYFQFLKQIQKAQIQAETEEIFGVCWFFINTIRNKTRCLLPEFSFKEDALFQLYAPYLKALYQKEGVYLQGNELFFAFFCFLESWNYNNQFGLHLQQVLTHNYRDLTVRTQQFVLQWSQDFQLPALADTHLAENLMLLLLKYNESPDLADKFEADYQQSPPQKATFATLQEDNLRLLQQDFAETKENKPVYLLHLIMLLQQQAFFSLEQKTRTVYFLFQSEPAWKAFLEQELKDYLGKRIALKTIEVTDLPHLKANHKDLIVSNFPLDQSDLPIFYISTFPTKNELRQLAELTFETYL